MGTHEHKWARGSWTIAYAPVVLAWLGPSKIIAPGDDYRYTFDIQAAPQGSNTIPQFAVPEIPGTYRLVWEIYASGRRGPVPGLGRKLPVKARISNTFKLAD